jgi:hypothetical protein
VDVELSWTGGFGSKLHTVYFGDTFVEIDNATGGQAQGTTTYTPGSFELAKTYYWRVDEFDIIETHKGDVWSFITEGAVGSLKAVEISVQRVLNPDNLSGILLTTGVSMRQITPTPTARGQVHSGTSL